MSTDPKTSSISIIIPTYNEAECISRFLPQLLAIPDLEVIVADGGSTDDTVALARGLGAQVLSVSPGKARQMNAGAHAAGSGILLFLHADTMLPADFTTQVHGVLSVQGVAAGAFRLQIDAKGLGLRIIEWSANFRSRFLQLPYGDQAIFTTAEMFWAVGGYPSLPIMEDFELVRRLRRKGRIKILPQAVTTSARRWKKLGLLRTTAINQAVTIGHLLKIDPQKLASWYRKER